MKATFGIIGMGFIFDKHKEAILKNGGEIIAVCDIDESKKAKYDAPFFTDYERMLKCECSHVSILTPNYLHYKMIIRSLLASKKVLVEKPPVLSIAQADFLSTNSTQKNLNVVLQLRHHPEVLKIKETLPKGFHHVSLSVKVKRDLSYWQSWKGDSTKSGGVLFNIGVHYLDLLIFLFGSEYTVLDSHYSDKSAFGKIQFKDVLVEYDIGILDTAEGQTRSLKIDGKEIELCNKDSLAYENLHEKVYEAMLNGTGTSIEECIDVIKLATKLTHEK